MNRRLSGAIVVTSVRLVGLTPASGLRFCSRHEQRCVLRRKLVQSFLMTKLTVTFKLPMEIYSGKYLWRHRVVGAITR